MRSPLLAAVVIACVLGVAHGAAADIVDSFSLRMGSQPNLIFPASATAFVAGGGESRLFKPNGNGPFPGLVIMPTCAGHSFSLQSFDWAQRALAHGYAVMVVDPLAPRGVRSNCVPPVAVTAPRLLKDAFDAADALRKEPFVDPDRVALIGFSQGAMVGLGAAGAQHSHPNAGKPFAAIVAFYPACIVHHVRLLNGSVVEARYVADRIDVPLFVGMGDQDTEGPMGDCIPALDGLKTAGAPVQYHIYHATHAWDQRETQGKSFHKTGLEGQSITYIFNPAVTEQSATDAFTFLEQNLKK